MINDREAILSQINDVLEQFFLNRSQTESIIRISEPFFNNEEIVAVIDSLLEGWLGNNWRARSLEQKIADFLGTLGAKLTNSGSSANLLAMSAMKKHYKLEDENEIIVPALSFPTTINAILFNKLTPVLIDSTPGSYLLDETKLDEALTPRTRGIFVVHSVGNVANMQTILEFANKHNLFVIEDACDALGGSFNGKKVGSFGDIATLSFYPAHQMTTGEGGGVTFQNSEIGKLLQSLRDWGRIDTDLWELEQSTLHKEWRRRFKIDKDFFLDWYDWKFTYTNVGFNFKLTEFQAAIGLIQLRRLREFIAIRQRNFAYLYECLLPLSEFFIMPHCYSFAVPSWLFFPLMIRPDVPFNRKDLIIWLETHNIETRPVLAGNIIRQPGYQDIPFKIIGSLKGSDAIMQRAICVGIHPGLTFVQLDYIVEKFNEFINKY